MLQRLHHIGHKPFRVDVNHPGIGDSFNNGIASGLQQLCFSQPPTPVEKERVIGSARGFSYLLCGCPGKLVGFSGHMRDKRKGGVKAPFKPNGPRRRGSFIRASRWAVAADVDRDVDILMPKLIRKAFDLSDIIALDGLSDVAVCGQQG